MQHVADAIHALVAEPCLISNLGSTCHDNDHHSDGGDQFKFNDIYLLLVILFSSATLIEPQCLLGNRADKDLGGEEQKRIKQLDCTFLCD